MAQTRQNAARPAAQRPKWDSKQGKPADEDTERAVEKAHGRYSASGQGEERQKRDPAQPPHSHSEDGYADEPKQR